VSGKLRLPPPCLASFPDACYTQEEIAEREGMTREGVRDILANLGDFGKLAENAKAYANHAVDFEVPLYNVLPPYNLA
jgi:hypothetical protein